MNLERLSHNSFHKAVALSAHGAMGKPTLLWMPILPSAAGLAMLLQASKMGTPPSRWLSPVAAKDIKPELSRRLATQYVIYAGRLFGTRMPAPEYVTAEQVNVVADSLSVVLRGGKGCVLLTSPSSAVRVCKEFKARQSDLAGVTFVLGGEPLTPAKMAELRASGAHAVNLYAFAEGGVVGFGCAGRDAVSDDVHILTGALAVTQHRRETPFGGGTLNALLFTTLFDKSPKILLNAENGDYGTLEERHCGCELGDVGSTRHLHSLHSFDKLTGEGMTFVGTDLVRVMEAVLPARFGGASTDYQMVEYEDVEGRTRLDLVVDPGVGDVDENELVRVVLMELGRGGDTNRMMAEMWRQGGMLRVRRERPHVTAGGKLLPLHIMGNGRK